MIRNYLFIFFVLLFFLFPLFSNTQSKVAMLGANHSVTDEFSATAQIINDIIECCGKLQRQILFSKGGEVILSDNERFNFFYMVPFRDNDIIVKTFRNTIKYKRSISVYQNATGDYEVTFKVAEEKYVVVSRFENKEDAFKLYEKMLKIMRLCKKYKS